MFYILHEDIAQAHVGQRQGPARQAAIFAGIPDATGATTINKLCGSGMKATMQGHDGIVAGSIDVAVTGGFESMTNIPYMVQKARQGMRMGHGQFLDAMFWDGLEDAYEPGQLMGHFAEATAQHFQFTREQQDEYAIRSLEQENLGEARDGRRSAIEVAVVAGPRG